MHLSPSGMSMLVKELEEQMGARLFDRTTRSLTLTDGAGKVFTGNGIVYVAAASNKNGGFLNVEGVDLAHRGLDPSVVPVNELGVPTYDELVALVSHVPQLAASTLMDIAAANEGRPVIEKTLTIAGAVKHLASMGGKVGVMGFCMGGALTIASAVHIPGLSAAV